MTSRQSATPDQRQQVRGPKSNDYNKHTRESLTELALSLPAPWGDLNRERFDTYLSGSVFLAAREAALADDLELAYWARQACAQAADAGICQTPTGPRKMRVQVSASPGLLARIHELADDTVSAWAAGAIEWALARREAS